MTTATRTKHTPGPWTFTGGHVVNRQHGWDGYIIAEPRAYDLYTKLHHNIEAEANGRLIAAAPELLEACRKLARLGDWTGPAPKGFTPAWEAAMHAIAKTRR